MKEVIRSFGTWDYVVFALLFVISASIGLFFAFRNRKKSNDAQEYLMGGRHMHAVPVAFSLTAGFLSAITVLGTPSEFYVYGTMFTYYCFVYVIVGIVASEIYIPLFYNLGITSTYEYLELRFNKYVRVAGTTIYIINQVLYIGIVIYAPALALNEVTGLDLWTSVIVTGVVCTFYTTLGGLKAVIWTDVFQCTVMVVGFLAVIIQGCIRLGGFENVWKIAERGGRIDFVHFEGDPRVRHTFWSILTGGTFLWTGIYCTTQTVVQRYLCCRTLNHARLSVYLNAVGVATIAILAGMAGLTMYAYYVECDPFSAGWVSATDQLMPYFVMDILYEFPGLPGVFLCSTFSGTLSTVSSGINAMAAVTLEDYIKPIKKDLSQRAEVWISKILVIFFGGCCLAMSALASNLGGVLNAALSINGMISGPMVALFTMGWAFPWINSWGALSGVIVGVGLATWIYIGSTIYPPSNEFVRKLYLSTESCEYGNTSTSINYTTVAPLTTPNFTLPTPPAPPIADWYAMSYLYYGVFGFVAALVVGHIVSFATGFQKPSELPPGVTIAFFDHPLFGWLPKQARKFLRCGVQYNEAEKSNLKSEKFDTVSMKTDNNGSLDKSKDNHAYSADTDSTDSTVMDYTKL
uniref:sodium-coupled monocarboxylate transporter 1 n=1 Tax=Ciona intestinalis TaxID=7719 RepID=UPI000052321F|nr:sodium-coupled monocarboxylate transporter 1 [Ciona intestinalis]|eukprot:XP_002131513.1 sodium-coupled monocarboxylate transporter 1 [Ciona intestinalis]